MIEGIPIVMSGRELKDQFVAAAESAGAGAEECQKQIARYQEEGAKAQALAEEAVARRNEALQPLMVKYHGELQLYLEWQKRQGDAAKELRETRGYFKRRRFRKENLVVLESYRDKPRDPSHDDPEGAPTSHEINSLFQKVRNCQEGVAYQSAEGQKFTQMEEFYAFRAMHIQVNEEYRLTDEDLLHVQIHPVTAASALQPPQTKILSLR